MRPDEGRQEGGEKTKTGFLARHRIVRNAVKQDLLQFGLPALVVFTSGLVLSGSDGWRGLAATAGSLLEWRQAPLPPAWESAGLIMVVAGLAIALVAVATLRMSYSSTLVIRQNHRLVTHGIYRFVRHPVYFGVLMVCLGVPVHSASPVGVVTMAVLIPILLNRIRLEEGLLSEEFGEAYEAYSEATSKLVPFLY